MQLAVAESLLENKCLNMAIAAKGLNESCTMLSKNTKDEICIGYFTENVYFGLHKRGDTNFTKWINSVPLNYTTWLPGQPEPNLFATEECASTW
jgi:hypothetical protein